MVQTNVHYNEQPDNFEIRRAGSKAIIVFPTGVTSETVEDEGGEVRTEYVASKVYLYETTYTPNLANRVAANFDRWLALAKVPETPKATIADLEEAINTLTDIILGG